MHQGGKEARFEMQGHSTYADHCTIQVLESGHGEYTVNGLDEGWMRVSCIMDSAVSESVALPTSCPHNQLVGSLGPRAGV